MTFEAYFRVLILTAVINNIYNLVILNVRS